MSDALQTRYDAPAFGPETETEDEVRYTRQLSEILYLIKDGVERSVGEINAALGYAPGTRSDSRLRDLRKARWGAWPISSRRCADGVYRYRVTQPKVRA